MRITGLPTNERITDSSPNQDLIILESLVPPIAEWKEQKLQQQVAELDPVAVNPAPIVGDIQPQTGREEIVEVKPKPRPKSHKFNYASLDCGAKVLAANPGASEISSIVVEARDRYLLNPCNNPEGNWVIIELCDNVHLESISIANYEFFSSMFKDIQISGSDEYPPRHWNLISNFTARNIREIQTFDLPPDTWAKFLKIEVMNHYGSEFYCPISVVRAHGFSVSEEIKEDWLGEKPAVVPPPIIDQPIEISVSSKPMEIKLPDMTLAGLPVKLKDGEEWSWTSLWEKDDKKDHPPVDAPSITPTPTPFDLPSPTPSPTQTMMPSTSDASDKTASADSPSPTKTPENIFKTLANRIKALELNHSLTSQYIEESTKNISGVFREIRKILETLNTEHNRLLNTVYEVAEANAVKRAGMESRFEQEMERRMEMMLKTFDREMMLIRDEINIRDQAQSHEVYTILVIAFLFFALLFYLEIEHSSQNLKARLAPVLEELPIPIPHSDVNKPMQVSVQKTLVKSGSDNEISSTPSTKKPKKQTFKKSRSMYVLNT